MVSTHNCRKTTGREIIQYIDTEYCLSASDLIDFYPDFSGSNNGKRQWLKKNQFKNLKITS